MRQTAKSVSFWQGGGRAGYVAEFYTDDDGASGYGDDAMVAYWHGTRRECEEISADDGRLVWVAFGCDR